MQISPECLSFKWTEEEAATRLRVDPTGAVPIATTASTRARVRWRTALSPVPRDGESWRSFLHRPLSATRSLVAVEQSGGYRTLSVIEEGRVVSRRPAPLALLALGPHGELLELEGTSLLARDAAGALLWRMQLAPPSEGVEGVRAVWSDGIAVLARLAAGTTQLRRLDASGHLLAEQTFARFGEGVGLSLTPQAAILWEGSALLTAIVGPKGTSFWQGPMSTEFAGALWATGQFRGGAFLARYAGAGLEKWVFEPPCKGCYAEPVRLVPLRDSLLYVVSVVDQDRYLRPNPDDVLLNELDATGAVLGSFMVAGARGCSAYATEGAMVQALGRELDIVFSCDSMRQAIVGSGQPYSTPAAEHIRVRLP